MEIDNVHAVNNSNRKVFKPFKSETGAQMGKVKAMAAPGTHGKSLPPRFSAPDAEEMLCLTD